MSHAHEQVGTDAVTIGAGSDDLTYRLIGFYVGTTGDVAVITNKDTTLTFKNVPAGAIIPVHIKKILATGTTASNIVGFKP